MTDTFPPPPSASLEAGGVQLRRRKGPPPPPAAPPAEPPSPASSLCSSRYSLISLSRPPSFLFKFQQSILVGIEKRIVMSFYQQILLFTGRRLPPPPPSLGVAKTGKNRLNEEITPLLVFKWNNHESGVGGAEGEALFRPPQPPF